ncbi:MAG: hypothetical protein IAE91_10105 [Ignavibacteriaceae bacterium]|nr:hypothetical protein [Ignavibacteriaceae bacterium]
MAISPSCKKCNKVIESENINVAADTAYCSECHFIFRLSDLLGTRADSSPKENPLRLPPTMNFTLEKTGESSFVITQIRTGSKLGAVGILFFAGFWNLFLVVWTGLALTASVFFALFSLPFWAAGIYLLYTGINQLTEKQIILIDYDGITVKKQRKFNPVNLFLRFSEIGSVSFEAPSILKTSTPVISQRGVRVKIPTIIHNGGMVQFFETALDAEKNWAVEFLSYIVEGKQRGL